MILGKNMIFIFLFSSRRKMSALCQGITQTHTGDMGENKAKQRT